jgi:diadenylate cyclase
MPTYTIGFLTVTVFDILDILIISAVLYQILMWLKGTRAVQMALAILFIILIALMADWWQFDTLAWMLSGFKTMGILAFFILFQPEIRRALTRLGQYKISDIFFRQVRGLIPVREITEGAIMLSRQHQGALIAIEKKVGLKNFIETGHRMDSVVSAEIINTIFSPNTPLHDGAVIIQENLLAAAGCELPLIQDTTLEYRALGMRHRAGLGLAADTDAVVIICSEETGNISVIYRNDARLNVDQTKLEELIEYFLDQ